MVASHLQTKYTHVFTANCVLVYTAVRVACAIKCRYLFMTTNQTKHDKWLMHSTVVQGKV